MTVMQASRHSLGFSPPARGIEVDETFVLFFWISLSLSASLTGIFFPPGDWYLELAKPVWTPPGWLFGPAWAGLYFFMGCTAFLVWGEKRHPGRRLALSLYLAQLALNALWMPLFFGLQRPDIAMIGIIALDIAVVLTLLSFWRVRRAAGVLLLPYLAWVLFASALNLAILQMNPL